MFSFVLIFLVMSFGLLIAYFRRKKKQAIPQAFLPALRSILERKVAFYQQLDDTAKKRFEQDVSRFLSKVKITGVDTIVDITDRLLVASSAVIPVFGFPEWDYTFLSEVLLYPGLFDRNYAVDGKSGEYISGMVGSGGAMEGKMILSKPSLHLGFDNTTDRQNVGIHEFIHLLDKEDGNIDGVLTVLNHRTYALPWLELIRKKTSEMLQGEHELNIYGATNQQEFLAVAGEYFFERPHQLKQNHPELYELLAKAFNQDTSKILSKDSSPVIKLTRNSPCPCGSGKKYKKCCLSLEEGKP
jgi:Mlc titration factor MtfA (ptsG expression regulator)